MQRRQFGKTGETVSAIGWGGSHIGETSSEDLAIRMVRTAIDRGVRMEDPDRFFAEGGCAGSVPGCEEGRQTRFIGFTGHKDPAIHLRILGMAREKCLHFDAVLFPSNVMDWSLP